MSIFRKKATVIAGLFCAVAFCFSLGLSALKPTKVEAATTMPAATTVEDLVNGSSTNLIGYIQQGGMSLKDLDKYMAYQSNPDYYRWYLSTKAQGEDDYSTGKYAGNLSYWCDYQEGTETKVKSILFPSTDKESVISLRAVAQDRLYLMGDMPQSPYIGYGSGVGGWTFVLEAGVKNVSLNRMKGSDITSTTNMGRVTLNTAVEVGDDLVITFGAKTETAGRTYYLGVQKYVDGALTLLGSGSIVSNEQIPVFNATTPQNNKHLVVGTYRKNYLNIGGVNKPIFAGTTVGGVTVEGEQTVGAALSTIANKLPEGYAFKDGTQKIVAGLGVYAVQAKYYEKSYGEAYAYVKGAQTVTNLEDKVGSRANLGVSMHGIDLKASNAVWNNPNAKHDFATSTFVEGYNSWKYAYSLSDKKSDGSTLNNAYTADFAGYTYKKLFSETDLATAQANTVTPNLNKYDGNVSFWASHVFSATNANGTVYSEAPRNAGLNFSQTAINDVVSYRFAFHNVTNYCFSLANVATQSLNDVASNGASGYVVYWKTTNNTISVGKKTAAATVDYTSGINAILGANGNASWGLTKGDEVIVTFGVYETVYGGVSTYGLVFKLQKADGTVLFENTYIDTNPTTTYWNGNVSKMSYFVSAENSPNYTKTNDVVISVGGINKPLITEGHTGEALTATTEDAALSSVTLPDGYAFKTPTELAIAGTNEYDGTYTGEYYGKQYTINTKITVTATALPRFTVTLKDGAGAPYSTEQVKTGATYALPEYTVAGKLFLGWIDENEKLYPAGYSYSVSADVTYTAAEIEYRLLDGASVRLKTNENGDGGIRFVLLINKADYDKYSKYMTGLMGVIAPTDSYISGGKFVEAVYENNFVGKTALDLETTAVVAQLDENKDGELDGVDYVQVPFAMTDIKYSNFNRAFSATSYFTVNYEGGATKTLSAAYDAAKNSRSIYDISAVLLDEHYGAKYEGNVGTLSTGELAIVERYVNKTVDIVVTEKTEGELEVGVSELEAGIEYRTEDGKQTVGGVETDVEDIPYTVTAQVAYENGVYTVTLTVAFDEDNALEETMKGSDGNYHVPVTVRITDAEGVVVEVLRMGVDENGKVVYQSVVYDETTKTATIVFTYKA